MSVYIFREVEVRAPRSKKVVPGEAIVDTAAPFTVLPLEWALRAGVKLGPVAPNALPVGKDRPPYRPAKAVVRLTGHPEHEIDVRVPETPWHGEHGDMALLGSNFLQPAKAKIDYSRTVRGRHPVTSNPPPVPSAEPIFNDYPVTPESLRIPGARVVCPSCRRSILVVRGGKLKAHDFNYRRCPGSCHAVLGKHPRRRPGDVA